MKKLLIIITLVFFSSCNSNKISNETNINSGILEEKNVKNKENLPEILTEDFQKGDFTKIDNKTFFSFKNGEIISNDKNIKIEKLLEFPKGFLSNKEQYCKNNENKLNILNLNFCLEKDYFCENIDEKDYFCENIDEKNFSCQYKKSNEKNYLSSFHIRNIDKEKIENFSFSDYFEIGGRENILIKLSLYKNILFADEYGFYEGNGDYKKYNHSFIVIFNGEKSTSIIYNKNSIFTKRFFETLFIKN